MALIKGKQIAAGSIALDRLVEAVIQADGGQAFTADQSLGGFKITNLANGTAATDAVNKQQLDGVAAGLSWKDAAIAATTAQIANTPVYANGTLGVGATLTRTGNGAWSSSDSDGVTLVQFDRLLVKNQTASEQNGLYSLTTVGSGAAPWVLTRVTDADVSAELDSAAIFVQQGTVNADTGWTQVSNAPVIGTDPISWVQFTGTGSLSYGTPVSVGTANSAGVATSVSRSDHVHDSPVAVTADKNLTALATTTDNDQATSSTVTSSNALGGYVGVRVNGVHYLVGNGTKVSVDCYFSNDSGSTARAMSAIASGDTLHWNGSVAGFELATSDRIDFVYSAF
jgi:hypothetical protein